ncbi:MAG: hypothetical protein ACREE6_02020, partial [Limisphaerales bacterium]
MRKRLTTPRRLPVDFRDERPCSARVDRHRAQRRPARQQADTSVASTTNRSLTVAAQMGSAQQRPAREQADTGVASTTNRSLTVAPSQPRPARQQADTNAGSTTNRSLTVAAQMGVARRGQSAPASGPRAYFITFSCYGAWLHGDRDGSVDPRHNVFATPVISPNLMRYSTERKKMEQPPYELDSERRGAVLHAIREVCRYRGWWLFAVHVRTAHVHVIVPVSYT